VPSRDMSLTFHHVSTSTVRETIANGALAELEFGLLKRHGEKLHWRTKEKSTLLDMATDVFVAKTPAMEMEVHIRSLCHSHGVTADYVSRGERFNLRKCILVVGEVGVMPEPWAELVQPAVHLFMEDFNVLWVEVPTFATNSQRWLRYGPAIMRAALKALHVESVSVLSCGVGGALFLDALAQSPSLFGTTHLVHNLDLPRASRAATFPVQEIEDLFRERTLQLWCTYNDEPGVYEHQMDGTAQRAYEAVTKMQSRLEGERRRGKRHLDYDEILITEDLNTPRTENIWRVQVGRNVLLAFSEAFLASAARFFRGAPETFQSDLRGGLVIDARKQARSKTASADRSLAELPALRMLRIGPTSGERAAVAQRNRRRLDKLPSAMLCLAPAPTQPAPLPLSAGSQGSKRLGSLGSSPSAPAMLSVAGANSDGPVSGQLDSSADVLVLRPQSGEGLRSADYHDEWLQTRAEMGL